MSQFNRRDSLKSLAALASVTTLGGWSALASAQKPLTIGVIYVGPRDDYGYNQAHAQAAAELKKMPGLKVVEEENVPETAAVQKTMTGMIAQDGAGLLFPTSFGYFDPHILAVAPKNPDVPYNKQVVLNKGSAFYQHCYAIMKLNGRGATVDYYEDSDGGRRLFSEVI